MRGLTIIIATDEPARFDTALHLAGACAALGGRSRVHADAAAVSLLRGSAGLICAQELGVAFSACQTGLADQGMTVEDLAAGVETGGMVGLLSSLGDDRLVVV